MATNLVLQVILENCAPEKPETPQSSKGTFGSVYKVESAGLQLAAKRMAIDEGERDGTAEGGAADISLA